MRKLSAQSITAAMIAFALLLSMSVQKTSAQVMERMIGQGSGVTGTFNCDCVSPGSGTCQVSQGPGGLSCSKGNGTCTGECELHTTTTGLTPPPIAAQPSGDSGQPSRGTVMTPNFPASKK